MADGDNVVVFPGKRKRHDQTILVKSQPKSQQVIDVQKRLAQLKESE